jgi:hypothetical protein
MDQGIVVYKRSTSTRASGSNRHSVPNQTKAGRLIGQAGYLGWQADWAGRQTRQAG